MSLPTAKRYLDTLMELGYVVRDYPSKAYQLTPKVLRLGSWVIEGMDLRSRMLPFIKAITAKLNVTTGCVILDGTEVMYIERFRSSDVVNLDLIAGSRLPVYCTSLGKAILAFMDEEECRDLLRKIEFVSLTPFTVTDVEVLWEELRATRERGYSKSSQELTVGMSSMAVPILDRNGRPEGSLGCSYPTHRGQTEGFEKLIIEELLRVSQEVSGH